MELSQAARLWLYIAMAILPVWIDFFKLSTDYTLRGLAMPILTSINAAVVVALARTSPRPAPDLPKTESGAIATEVTNPPTNPLPVTQTPPT